LKKISARYLFGSVAAALLISSAAYAQELPAAPQPQYVSSVVSNEASRGGSAAPEGIVSVSTLKAEAGLPTGTVSINALMAAAERAPQKPKHNFFDRTSWLLTGVETSAMLADGITTHNRLGQVQTRFVNVNGVQTLTTVRITEANPLGRLFVNHGWGGMAAGGALNLGADMGIRYLLHKTGHHKLERIVPLAFTASSASAAIHNTAY